MKWGSWGDYITQHLLRDKFRRILGQTPSDSWHFKSITIDHKVREKKVTQRIKVVITVQSDYMIVSEAISDHEILIELLVNNFLYLACKYRLKSTVKKRKFFNKTCYFLRGMILLFPVTFHLISIRDIRFYQKYYSEHASPTRLFDWLL